MLRFSFLFALALSVMLLPPAKTSPIAAAKPASTPIIVRISPNHAYNNQATMITINGAGFVATPIVTASTCFAGPVILSDVAFVDSTTLTATVPADLPEGIYILKVINPDGGKNDPWDSTTLTIMRRGDGTFGPWSMTSSMTTERWRFAAVEANGYLYALGGYGRDSVVVLSSVERAKINQDGSLGPWQVVGALTTQRAGLAAVAVGNYIYAIGGEAGISGPVHNSVERAYINSDGSLGPWQVTSSMITPRYHLSAVATGGYLYAIGGFPGGSPAINSVERAAVNSDGSLGPWEPAASTTRARSSAVAVDHFIYALGGDNSVERSQVNPDGSLVPWQIISSTMVDRTESAAVAMEGYLYALGGFFPCIYSTNSVERAVINSDGTLGPWQLTASMLEGRSGFGAVAAGERIYAMGGALGWGGGGRSVEHTIIIRDRVFLPSISR